MKTPEERLHANCYKWFHNNYPHLRGLLCYNLNNSANKIQGGKNKLMGLQKGRSDMVFYYNGTAYMIEFKTNTGIQSKEQKVWQKIVESHGFEYHIIRTLVGFKELIKKNIHENT